MLGTLGRPVRRQADGKVRPLSQAALHRKSALMAGDDLLAHIQTKPMTAGMAAVKRLK